MGQVMVPPLGGGMDTGGGGCTRGGEGTIISSHIKPKSCAIQKGLAELSEPSVLEVELLLHIHDQAAGTHTCKAKKVNRYHHFVITASGPRTPPPHLGNVVTIISTPGMGMDMGNTYSHLVSCRPLAPSQALEGGLAGA